MSDKEFLARWSHRKREARTAVDAPQPTPPAAPSDPAPLVAAEHASAEPVDLSSLPPNRVRLTPPPTSPPSCAREFRGSCARRRFAAPGAPILPSGVSWAWRRTPGISTTRTRCPGSGRSIVRKPKSARSLIGSSEVCGRLPKVSPIRPLKPTIVRRWLLQRGGIAGHKR